MEEKIIELDGNQTMRVSLNQPDNINDVYVVIEKTEQVTKSQYSGSVKTIEREIASIDSEIQSLNNRKKELTDFKNKILSEITKVEKEVVKQIQVEDE